MQKGPHHPEKKDRLGQIQKLHRLLSRQLEEYSKGNFEEGIALYTKLEECIEESRNFALTLTEKERKSYAELHRECQKTQEEIHALLEREQKKIKKEYLGYQIDLGLLRL